MITAALVLSLAAPVSAADTGGMTGGFPGEMSGEGSGTMNGAPEGTPGEMPGGNPGGPGGQPSSGNVTWSGAETISSSVTEEGKTYSSENADENALLVDTTGSVTITDPTVIKTGGSSASDNYSFYGINSGVMVKGGANVTITGGTVNTEAEGANGVFSYGANSGQTNATGDGTTVNITDTVITTTGNGSGGIMTTYGGSTNAKNLTVETSGGSSAPIRTDRGGGWVTVEGGTYTSNGQGSPAIYSTADVKVSDAVLTSNKSEGVVIEGTGSIALENCELVANNTALNGNAQFYDTVMIYQSMSGDASSGTSSFSMTGGKLISKNGDTFHVTNTECTIDLTNVSITNSSDGALISVCDDGWSGGTNKATLSASQQTLDGDILVGDDSELDLALSDGSILTGRIFGSITNDKGTVVSTETGTADVTLEEGTLWVLTGDSYVTSLSGSGKINYNGYTVYVDGKAYSAGAIGSITESEEASVKPDKTIKVGRKIKLKADGKVEEFTVSQEGIVKASKNGKRVIVKGRKSGTVTVKAYDKHGEEIGSWVILVK